MAVLLTALTLPTVAQNRPRTDPDHAKYSITGTMKVENSNRYLVGAVGRQIDFTYYNRRLARPTEMADLVVRFDSVTTNPFHPITKLDFWRYDEEIGEWIYDSEVRQGEQQMESTMKTNIMLVVDNSKSLGEDFKKVQDAAIEFVGQLYRESQGKDVFRVGVIGFSTIKFTRIREITTLDAANYREIVNFIRGLEMQNGTALYYSLEKALDMLESDVQRNIKNDEYKESRIYAFTDGLDQASVDDKRQLTTPTEYYDHLRPMMKGSSRERINNRVVSSTIVTVRGDDMTDKQERQFDQRAQAICDDVRKLKDMSELVSEFKKLAEDLVKSNMVLYCYIPVGASGRVGWTFRDEKAVVKVSEPAAPKAKSKFWLGINASFVYGGFEFEDSYYSSYNQEYYYADFYEIADLSIGTDFAWRLSPKFALGASVSLGMNIAEEEMVLRIGPLGKLAFDNNSALLFGAGATLSEWPCSYINVGYKFKSPWYVNALVYYNSDGFAFGLGVGYSILGGKN